MNHYQKGVVTYTGWPDKAAGHIQVITIVEVSPYILFRKTSYMQDDSNKAAGHTKVIRYTAVDSIRVEVSA